MKVKIEQLLIDHVGLASINSSSCDKLCQSIRENGFLDTPMYHVEVVQIGSIGESPRYLVVHGSRRVWSALVVGIKMIPVVVVKIENEYDLLCARIVS